MYYRIPQTGDPGDLGGGKASLREMNVKMEPTTNTQQKTESGPKPQKLMTLVWDLAKNDFRVRFAGSYFGIIWAFAQPVATILVFWFVFQVGFRAAPSAQGVPYALWLAAGLTPWFFFAEGLMTATASFTDYSYLVKKVVFKIELIPVVKVVSAMFFHLAFMLVVALLSVILGNYPGLHWLQLPYYGVCMIALVLALGTLTASILPFFRDLTQLLNIVLQFGMWLTPILWRVEMIPERYRWVFKLNPVGYIVEGYRDSLFGGAWVWEHWATTLGFWSVAVLGGGFSRMIYRRLRPHFADVL